MVSPLLSLFDQSSGAPCRPLCCPVVSSSSLRPLRIPLCGQHHSFVLSPQGGRHLLSDSQCGGSVNPVILRGASNSSCASVQSRSPQCAHRLSQSPVSSSGFRVASLSAGLSDLLRRWPATIDLFATIFNHRLPVYFSPMFDPQSAGTDAMMQSWVGLQAYALSPIWSASSCPVQGPAVSGVGANVGGSVLVSASVVPGASGAFGGGSVLPSTAEGSTQTAAFPLLPPKPPCAQADCVSFVQRSARHFGFSSAVARQLAYCRRPSTRLNYQAKWTVYCEWYRRHGHSVS